MSGLPWVAEATTPLSAEAFIGNLDKRLLEQERQYEGPARGSFSRFAVRLVTDLPVVPDGTAAYVVAVTTWYQRTAGAWVMYGPARPPA